MTTGAGADKVLISDASGVASWGTSTDTDTWITTQTCSTDYALQSVGKTTKTCINKVDYSDVAYDVSCTNCLTNVEVASSDTASDLTCTDCIGPTEITDSYVLNTTDSMSGNLTVGGDLTVTGASTNFRNAIKAVDGSGSLIDADMVDGQHASDLGAPSAWTCTTVSTCARANSNAMCAVGYRAIAGSCAPYDDDACTTHVSNRQYHSWFTGISDTLTGWTCSFSEVSEIVYVKAKVMCCK